MEKWEKNHTFCFIISWKEQEKFHSTWVEEWIITERSRDTGEVREVILRWLPWKQLFPNGLRGFYRVIRNLLRYCLFQRQFLVIQMPILNFPHRTNQEKDGLPKQTNVDTMILKSLLWWHLKAEKWWWAFFKLSRLFGYFFSKKPEILNNFSKNG